MPYVAKLFAPGEDLVGVDVELAGHARHRGTNGQRSDNDGALKFGGVPAIGAAFRRRNDWLNFYVDN